MNHLMTSPYLTGDWGGSRTQLEKVGVKIGFVYTGEVMATIRGGIQRDADYLHNFDLTLEFDLEKIIQWPGASIFIYGLGNNGGNPSATDVGDFQGVSNIEAPATWKLYEAWFQQNFFGERISLLAGLHDLNSEFDVIETAGLFMDPSHGIGPDFSQSGLNGPSIFPTTSLGARVRAMPLDFLYFQGAVYDGVAGSDQRADYPDHSGTEAHFHKDEGFLIVAEAGVQLGKEGSATSELPYGKYALGAWIYTANFEDILEVVPNDPDDDEDDEPLMRDGNKGIYAFMEQQIIREKEDPDQGLALFIRLGWANPNFNDISVYTGGGLVYTGLIPTREQDQVGFAVAAVHVGNKFKQANYEAETPVKDEEVNLEFTYRIQVMPWFALQPNFQYVINPGLNPLLQDAWVIGSRWEFSF